MGFGDWVHLDVSEVLHETDKALCVRLEDGEEIWLPKSQISDPENYAAGDQNCTISVSQWIAEQKGLE